MSEEIKTAKVLDNLLVAEQAEDGLIHLSTGVVLRGKKANTATLIKVISAFPRPKPPVYFNKTMGRNMENPDDPDYVERVTAWKTEQGSALINTMILLGTELVSKPDNVPGPHPVRQSEISGQRSAGSGQRGKKRSAGGDQQDELVWPAWIGDYELLGIPMNPQSESWRYLTWITFVAAPGDEDLKTIQEVVGRLSGVREADAKAAEEFPKRNEDPR